MNKCDKGVLGTDQDGKVYQAPSLHNAEPDLISISGVSAESTAAIDSTLVYLVSDVACFVRSGVTGGTAVVTDVPILANVPYFWTIKKGHYIQAITAGATGTLTAVGC